MDAVQGDELNAVRIDRQSHVLCIVRGSNYAGVAAKVDSNTV
jgi:hypothetical protein